MIWSWLTYVLLVASVQSLTPTLTSVPVQTSPPSHHRDYKSQHISKSNDLWDLPPVCRPSEESGYDYCVFTSTKFAGGRGISILARRDRAERIFQLSAFTNPGIYSAIGANDFSNLAFYATELQGRGIGLIANRTIKQGEWLMAATPAFIMDYGAHQDLSSKERLHFQRLAFDRLPDELKQRSYALYGQSGEEAVDLIDDVLDTNTFGLPVQLGSADNEYADESGQLTLTDIGRIMNNNYHTGNVSRNVDIAEEDDAHDYDEDDDTPETTDFKFLFPEIARFNHACRPNSDYYFDSNLFLQHIIAHRDIFAGEELKITYIYPLQRRRARQKALHRSWGFRCDCQFCAASPEDIDASDARVDKILELQTELEDKTAESDGSPLLAEQYIRLLRKEGLWSFMRAGYAAAAVEYNGVGDELNAQKYAQLALQKGHICRSAHSTDSDEIDLWQLMKHPREHESWQFRLQS